MAKFDDIDNIQVKYRGDSARVHQLSLAAILPDTQDYVSHLGMSKHSLTLLPSLRSLLKEAPHFQGAGKLSHGW